MFDAIATRHTILLNGALRLIGLCGLLTLAPVTLPAQTALGPVLLNQHGITGSWFNRSTSGQGFTFEVYPDLVAPGQGLFTAGWYTFDVFTPSSQRWYTLTGATSTSASTADLDIYTSVGGNFDAPPALPASTKVGYASISFSDCNTASISYTFFDGSNRTGTIPLQRLTSNVTCGPVGDSGAVAGDYLLSGAWDEAGQRTSGQGLVFDINPVQNLIAAAWYTFAVNGSVGGGGQSQRWFTLQSGSFVTGSKSISGVNIYASTNGIFDAPDPVSTNLVGRADISFASCNAMTLDYAFTSGENNGNSGSISLVRVGPEPTGCSQWFASLR